MHNTSEDVLLAVWSNVVCDHSTLAPQLKRDPLGGPIPSQARLSHAPPGTLRAQLMGRPFSCDAAAYREGMQSVTGKRAVTAILFVILLACGTPTGGCSCSPLTYQIHFVGFVTKNQAPVTGTRVTASVLDTDCQSTAGALAYLAPNGAVIDSTGHYRFELQTWRPDTLCARLVARAGTDSAVRDSVRVQIPSVDTVRVDFTLP